MSFVSLAFASLFLVVLALRTVVGKRSNDRRYIGGLIVANLVFYAWHVPAYLAIILASTIIDYVAGRWLGAHEDANQTARRRVLMASLCTNLGLLAWFKYANFFLDQVAVALSAVGMEAALPEISVILPMGISFYTFQSMSYTIDVYRGRLPAERRFSNFLLYVSFFPQLVAGPIVRAKDFLYQVRRPRRLHPAVFGEGVYLIARGLFLKVVVGDNIGAIVDHYWTAAGAVGGDPAAARAVAILFPIQIFADFAGYSSIARGLAYILGFRLPVNFNSPYIAGSFKDFWQRWHISLSQWFRDYLYVPLGGNRGGGGRTLLNLWLTMVIAGLWHGAAWTFIIWGALHGTALVLERALGLEDAHRRSGPTRVAWFVVVQGVVLVTWVFFRADDAGQALTLLANAVRPELGTLPGFPMATALLLLAGPSIIHVRTGMVEAGRAAAPGPVEKAALAAVLIYLSATCYGVDRAFLYFQF